MRRLLLAALLALVMVPSAAWAITDSSGTPGISPGYSDTMTWDRIDGKPETAIRWPTWNEVTEKPVHSSRWPTWDEVTGKPSTFAPENHNHDDRYVRKGTSSDISGNLDVSGTVAANRLVTGDVGGGRWCRANTNGRIMCTHDAPGASGGMVLGGGVVVGNSMSGSSRWGVAQLGEGYPPTLSCSEGVRRQTGYNPSMTYTQTSPGCDGGCNTTHTVPQRSYYLCVAN